MGFRSHSELEGDGRAFKRAAGGLGKASAALYELGCYEWRAGAVTTKGMQLRSVGRSGVTFRETRRKPERACIADAKREFPELDEYGWPERGAEAERCSLFFQASRYKRSVCPETIGEATSNLESRYPRTKVTREIRGDIWDQEEVAEKVAQIARQEVNLKASPGVPLASLGLTNAQIVDRHLDFLVLAVVARLELLSSYELVDSDLSPNELVRMGFCDPVRVFVKQEPHPKAKIEQGRFRLISSISLVDQLVERILFGPQNRAEIQLWHKIPSKPGMGLSLETQAHLLWDDLVFKHNQSPAAEADISGFDWSVQWWELVADLKMRIKLSDAGGKARMAMSSRFYCLGNSVFQLSNGEMWEQCEPGLMKSGSYCTSSSNSRIRCLMAELIGAKWCVAMGDDSVEGFVPDAKARYEELGHVCKDYIPCATNGGELSSVTFCSHHIGKNRVYLTTWAKTLYRFLSSDHETDEDLWMELHTNPNWTRIRNYLCRIGRSSDKRLSPEQTGCDGPEERAEENDSCRESRHETDASTAINAKWEQPSPQKKEPFGWSVWSSGGLTASQLWRTLTEPGPPY
nr:RdRp [Pistacia sobemo-like virus]